MLFKYSFRERDAPVLGLPRLVFGTPGFGERIGVSAKGEVGSLGWNEHPLNG
jgi:hypothetical protein